MKPILPSSVVTAPWVRLKCQFGCDGYNYGYCCPPHTPTYEETRKVLDSYHRALLFHIETSLTPGRGKRLKKFREMLVDLEGDMFEMTPEERVHAGIASLPGSLEEAIAETEKSELVREALGDHIFNKFIENKKIEWDMYRVHISQFELDRYLPIL